MKKMLTHFALKAPSLVFLDVLGFMFGVELGPRF